ncbi:MAG: putative solute-binding protein [Pseudomonadota bacterium]|nr:putative solute-binding protein [Pseudomonadota bacterium]
MNAKTLIATLFGLLFLVPVFSASANTDMEARRAAKLEATVMNPNLPLEKRIRALKKMQADEMVGGRIKRTFCVWDPLGKAGPISSTVEDQKLRSLHYGMDLSVITFQDEKELVEALRTDERCDAAVIRGSAAMEFNRFAGTIESVGGLLDRRQVQLLMQVMANPRMAPRLADENFTVLGVATMGSSYRFTTDRQALRSLDSFKGRAIATESMDPAMAALAKAYKGKAVEGDMMSNVQNYADGKVDGMISPIIAYLVMGSGQISTDVGIMKTEVAQSTIQLIGRSEKFPRGLAQILREDFLFKFDNYARRVDNELALIPSQFWMDDKPEDVQKLQSMSQKVRLAMRDQGHYDAAMLRLQRKIRCKFDPSRSECTNPVE